MSKQEAKLQKQPKIPTFPPEARVTYDLLNDIISEGSDRSTLAYGAMTRLCLIWSQSMFEGETPLGGGCRATVINDLIGLMFKLFPGGEGLPGRDGL